MNFFNIPEYPFPPFVEGDEHLNHTEAPPPHTGPSPSADFDPMTLDLSEVAFLQDADSAVVQDFMDLDSNCALLMVAAPPWRLERLTRLYSVQRISRPWKIPL